MSFRHLQTPNLPIGRIKENAPIEKGGTGGHDRASAVTSLGAIGREDLGTKIVKAGPNGKIPLSVIPGELSLINTIDGPTQMVFDSEAEYIMTSYDANNQPVVYVDRGNLVRKDDTLSVTSPEKQDPVLVITSPTDGEFFTLNIGNRSIEIPLVDPGADQPNIHYPSSVDPLRTTFEIQASKFSSNTFSYDEWNNATTSNVLIPQNASHIELRGRRGDNGTAQIHIAGTIHRIGVSRSRVTLPVTGPEVEFIVNGDLAYLEYRWVFPNVTHISTDWEIASDPEFATIVFSSLADTVNLTSIEVTLPAGTYYTRVRFRGDLDI